MKRRALYVFAVVLFYISVWGYVESIRAELRSLPRTGDRAANAEEARRDSTEGVVLKIWAPEPMLQQEIAAFETAHPTIDVQFTSLEHDPRPVETILTAFAQGVAPDIVVTNQKTLGAFNSTDLAADLSQAPFRLPAGFREEIGDALWDIHRSLEGDRLFAVPYDYHPYVLFYRADVLDELGFPSEPEALDAYMQTPAEWLRLAEALKTAGYWPMQWPDDLIRAAGNGRFFFTRSLEYARSTEMFQRVMEFSILSGESAANESVWSAEGQRALREGKYAMLMLPDWGEDLLTGWVPEQSGKWRATRLPLDASGIDIESSKSMIANAESRHPEAMAAFMNYVLETSGNWNWNRMKQPSDFLGGQHSAALYRRLVKEQPADTIPTPLDQAAFEAWESAVRLAVIKRLPPEEAIAGAEHRIMDFVRVPQRQLQEYLQKHRHDEHLDFSSHVSLRTSDVVFLMEEEEP